MAPTTGPDWANQMLKEYQQSGASVFLVHLNVDDYACAGNLITVKDWIAQMLSSRLTVLYNRAAGMRFPTEEMREKFLEVVGLAQTTDTQAGGLDLHQFVQKKEAALPRDPDKVFPLLDKAMRQPGVRVGLIMDYAETLVPDTSLSAMSAADRTALVYLQEWAKDPDITGESGKGQAFIVLLTRNLADLHSHLRGSRGIASIQVPLPRLEERAAFIDRITTLDVSLEDPPEPLKLAEGFTQDQLAMLTAGLGYMGIEDIRLRASLAGNVATPEMVRDRKAEIIRTEFADVIEVIDPRFGFEMIGGMDLVKDFFSRSVVRPMREGNRKRCPMGVLLMGPAGTGKTALAEAVAYESGINCVKLKIGGQIASKWQGEGERNLARALQCIDSLSPCLVIIDEIDQSVRRGEGDGQNAQENRIFQMLNEYLSDTAHRGRVVFLGMTNRPDQIDAAFKRAGRFDKKLPILVPTEDERQAIFEVMFKKYGIATTGLNLLEAAKATHGYTGAEIETVVVAAYEISEDSDDDDGSRVQQKHLAAALRSIRPSTTQIEYMTLLALAEVNDLRLLPPQYHQQWNNREQLEENITTLQERVEKTEYRRGKREI